MRTDQRTYSIQDIKQKTDRLGLRTSSGIPNAMTDPASPYVNAIANNAILQGSEYFGTWIYELGNSLAFITDRMPEIPRDAASRYDIAGEPGAAFEDCVFGGRLGANGSISRPK